MKRLWERAGDENEPDENEPDEDESPDPKTQTKQHATPTGTAAAVASATDHTTGHNTGKHAGSTLAPDDNALSQEDPNSNNSGGGGGGGVPASTVGPVTVAIVAILVVAGAVIFWCVRRRQKLNQQQRTSTINGWRAWRGSSENPNADDLQEAPSINVAAVPRKPLRKEDYDERNHYQHRFSKPAPELPAAAWTHDLAGDPRIMEKPAERSPSIILSPGWLYAAHEKPLNEKGHDLDKPHTPAP